jgi:hypothetical protein
VGRKPAIVYKGFYGLLLMQVQLEQRMSDLSQLLFGVDRVEVPSDALQLELASDGEGHDEEDSVESEQVVYSTLTYYMVQPIQFVLGIARFHAADEESGFFDVTEDIFMDTPEDFCRFENEVSEALEAGIDVCVMSGYEPDTFPQINEYLADALSS